MSRPFIIERVGLPANLWLAAVLGGALATILVMQVTMLVAPARADSGEIACADFTPDGQPVNQTLIAGIGDVPPSVWTVICHAGHVLAFNPVHNVSDWVAYQLNETDLLNSVAERTNNYSSDRSVPKGHRVTSKDYTGSGHDRGHLAPAAAMKWSLIAMSDSFLMSNIAPQKPGFNRGIWKSLEKKMRQWACERGELYIVTGPLYDGEVWPIEQIMYDKNKDGIDENGILIDIPSHFFKLAFDRTRNEAIAFIIPNEEKKGMDLKPFLVSIDRIEELSKLDVLPNLDDATERSVEGMVQPKLWAEPSDTQCQKLG